MGTPNTAIGRWLEDQDPKGIGQAIYEKYAEGKAYPPFPPNKSGVPTETILDHLAALLLIIEPVRTPYAYALGVAALQAMWQGHSIEEVLYRGTKPGAQNQALHPGTSSLAKSGVSGQLMEQNLGKGENAPHPEDKSKNLAEETFEGGVKRNLQLFQIAAKGRSLRQMFSEDVVAKVRAPKIRQAELKAKLEAELAKLAEDKELEEVLFNYDYSG